MAMAPMPSGPAPADEGGQPPGGASQLVADTHSNLLKLQELVDASFPEDSEELATITQAYQGFVEKLGAAPGQKQGPPVPGTTTPEAGAAKVQPAM